MERQPLLEIQNLSVTFSSEQSDLRAVEDVSFDVYPGETLGIVGESGCGKSVSCMSILRLIQGGNVRYESGQCLFEGRDTLGMSEKELRGIRGDRISMIFQEPMTALNPLYTIGNQMSEGLRLHRKMGRQQALVQCAEFLSRVKIPDAHEVLNRYPFMLSGGMRQRVMIAMAMITQPQLIICDEPTTALDVTIQAVILDLLKNVQKEIGCSYIFITHDLGVISEMSDRVLVMYAGRVCETAATDVLIAHPLHPYTAGLIASRPNPHSSERRLRVISGNVPSLEHKPPGCPFHPRCEFAEERCAVDFPGEREVSEGHTVCCWRYMS